MLRSFLPGLFALFLWLSSCAPVAAQQNVPPVTPVLSVGSFDSDPILEDFVYHFWLSLVLGMMVGGPGNTIPCSCARCW
jgi:hypothetical protein